MSKKLARRRRYKVSEAEAKQAYKTMTEVIAENQPEGAEKMLTRWKKRRAEKSQAFASKKYAEFMDAGGETGTGMTFKEWLKSLNWPAIIAFIMSLFA